LKNKKHNERLNPISIALFGAPDDVSPAEAVEDLEVAGINREDLHTRMYEKLCAAAREYLMRQEEIPPLLRRALDDLRKRVGPPKTKEEADRRADSMITKLLEAVKAPLANALSTRGLVFNASFRNKKSEQSTKDRNIIEKLEKDLLSDIENEEKENQD
jgi:hypothetical protein